MKAAVREIFSSVQGEGPYVGTRQIFIRFDGCNLSCRYCDTARSGAARHCRVEAVPGKRDFVEVANPLSGPELVKLLQKYFNAGGHHFTSLTGGEPLVHAEYLEGLLPAIKQMGLKVYLETNGTLYAELSRVIGLIDIVAMDIKLPGTSGCGPLWEKHHPGQAGTGVC
ncbi:MAG: 7-carboxy-7-deazaguanine synthase QueE [Actinobacteria bacterium]|nr:7-carboxy-7-deazaguanine synthase QueE [Actinomycetota bacterium]